MCVESQNPETRRDRARQPIRAGETIVPKRMGGNTELNSSEIRTRPTRTFRPPHAAQSRPCPSLPCLTGRENLSPAHLWYAGRVTTEFGKNQYLYATPDRNNERERRARTHIWIIFRYSTAGGPAVRTYYSNVSIQCKLGNGTTPCVLALSLLARSFLPERTHFCLMAVKSEISCFFTQLSTTCK